MSRRKRAHQKRETRKFYNRHHRKPKSLGGDGSGENMINVSIVKHQAWHVLFGNSTPEQIVRLLNNVWFDPAYQLILKRREVNISRD